MRTCFIPQPGVVEMIRSTTERIDFHLLEVYRSNIDGRGGEITFSGEISEEIVQRHTHDYPALRVDYNNYFRNSFVQQCLFDFLVRCTHVLRVVPEISLNQTFNQVEE